MIGEAVRRLKNKAFGTMRNVSRQPAGWTLVPSTQRDIDLVRKKCRRIVLRRAAISAGVAAVPIPGIDIATDISLLMRLMEEINAEFGLTPEQIERLQPKARIVVYQTIVGMGGVVVGKLVTRQVVTQLIKRTGVKMLAKRAAKIVPVAGQVASAALGFAAFRAIGYEHVDACARVAEELMATEAKAAHD
jgi:uncharacterized protein (DUF697 family)